MTVMKYQDAQPQGIRCGVERRLAYTEHLMMAVMDFYDGPQSQPDPPHTHLHEQLTYVAEGEILFFLEAQAYPLRAGDVVIIPSSVPHSIQLLTPHVRLIDCFTPIRQDFLSGG